MATQSARRPANRNNDLAAIHMATKALRMTEDDARALKLHITGKASAADMTVPQRRQLLAHLSGLQALAAGKPKPIYTGQRRELERSAHDGQDERWGKARALWALLARAGVVKVDTDAALNKYVQRQAKVEAWRFLNGFQITQVIEALKAWCSRANVEFEK